MSENPIAPPWSVIVRNEELDRWDQVASGDETQMTNVVNLYHKDRPDLDEKVRMIDPEGNVIPVEYGPTPLKDALPETP